MKKLVVLLSFFMHSCSTTHLNPEAYDAIPITNNPLYTGEEVEFEPSPQESWWKVLLYEIALGFTEEP